MDEDQSRRCDPVTLAQEVDIDYAASLEGICIPAAWSRRGRPAAARGLSRCRRPGRGRGGSAKSVLIARAGPVVRPPVAWGCCNTTQTAWRAATKGARLGASVVCYDAGGVGAGVKGTWDTAETQLPFKAQPVLFGDSPGDDVWPDDQTSKQKFLNLWGRDVVEAAMPL